MTNRSARMWLLAGSLRASRRLRRPGRRILCPSKFASVAVLLAVVAANARANPIYVDDDAPVGGDGTSWATAFNDLQDGLAVAIPGDEIWVAQGTYTPSDCGGGECSEIHRVETFQLISGVGIYGGFAGFESTLEERAGLFDQTILTGDLNGDDGPDFANNAENSIHVVTGSGTDPTSILDGFTVTGGNANGEHPSNSGGGMFNLSGSPTVTSCTFTRNWAWHGGGIYNRDGNPTLTDCAFTANVVLWYGGGVANYYSNPLLRGCSLSGNSATGASLGSGGGVYNYGSSPTVLDCTFLGNAAQYGGGMSNILESSPAMMNCVFGGNSAGYGGAVRNDQGSSPELVNCILNGNVAESHGGGMYNRSGRHQTITNTTFSMNSAGAYGGGLYNDSSGDLTLTNCILWGNTDFTGLGHLSEQIHLSSGTGVTVSYSCVQDVAAGDGGVYPGVGNTDEDPLLADALGPDGVPGTGDEALFLSPGSPCIDAGDNTAVPDDVYDIDDDGDTLEYLPVDQQGLPRLHDDPCTIDTGNPDPTLPGVGLADMGALEHQGEDTGDPDEDGITGCADNCPQHHNTDQADCDADGFGDVCRIELGVSADCNDNGVPDECDVAGGGSDDDDGNGIPDECSKIHFVDDDAPVNGDGTTWQTAYRHLQDALAEAEGGDEIHVAGGTYKPDQDETGQVTPGDRAATFLLQCDVRVNGGYAGLADPVHPDIRDVEQYESILSGDLNGDDGPEFADNSDNSKHVVTSSHVDENSILDGFTVTAAWDGGMYNYYSSPTVANCTFVRNMAWGGGGMRNDTSNPTVVDCTFMENSAEYGGGMYNLASSPAISGCVFSANGWSRPYYGRGGGLYNGNHSDAVITNCTFSDNWARTGGGMCNDESSPTVTGCAFTGNRSTDDYHTGGGGMYNGRETSPTVTDCTFNGNSAEGDGGGLYDNWGSLVVGCTFRGNWSMMGGGGIYLNGYESTVANSTFTGNRADYGGGICSGYGFDPLIVNCTLSGNSAGAGGGIYNQATDPIVSNCILWGNSDRSGSGEHGQIAQSEYDGGAVGVTFTCIQGLASFAGNGNIGHNPRFVDADGPDGVPGTEDDDVRLTPGSPCVDAGDNRAVPPDTLDLDDDGDTEEPLPFDCVGNLRFEDDPCVDDTGEPAPDFPTLSVVDMGAYERPDDSGADPDEDGLVNCDDNCPVHFNPIQEDCDEDGQGDACALAYCGWEVACRDCNENGVPDACDIDDGVADDADGNGVPDECQRVLFVDDDAWPGGDGASWPTAFKYLQDALAHAVAGDQIRVAQGIYTPDRDELGGVAPGDREATFQLLSGVALYGGYRGCPEGDCASGNPHERDIAAREAILSGDLLGDDPGPLENSYHVVTGSGTDKTAILDGFTITAGYADLYYVDMAGAGMYNYVGDPTVVNCTFTGNGAENEGGAMFNHLSSPAVVNCTFIGNWARYGGAMHVCSHSTPTLNNCTFENNSGSYGGALCNRDSAPTVVNCVFSGNTAHSFGGAMYNDYSSPTVTRCTFAANLADANHNAAGGAMYNVYNSSPTVTECTFVGNMAIGGDYSFGGAMYISYDSSLMLSRCVFTRNSADRGGGLYDYGDSMAANCLFRGNSANLGAGMFMVANHATLANCTFSGNRAHEAGGAIHGWSSSLASLANCTFAANSAPGGPALACDSVDHAHPGTYELDNCILRDGGNELWNNDGSVITIAFSNVQDDEPGDGIVHPGTGNIDTDPMFVRPPDDGGDGWGDDPQTPDIDEGLNDDYGDLRLTAGSPCIDSGDEAALPADAADLDQDGDAEESIPVDLDGHARVLCGGVDMGAYEFGIGDLNCNQAVNLTDFAEWDACMTGPDNGPYIPGCEPFDFEFDGDVDLDDFAGYQLVFASEP